MEEGAAMMWLQDQACGVDLEGDPFWRLGASKGQCWRAKEQAVIGEKTGSGTCMEC